MNSGFSTLTRGAFIISLLLNAPASAAAQEPVRLTVLGAGFANGHTFAAEFTQALIIRADGREIHVEREYRAGARLSDARVSGDSVRVTLTLDSARASTIAHGTRQVIDTRTMVGKSAALTYARQGGVARVADDGPAADFGPRLGGLVPVSVLFDALFPPIPAQPVRVRDSWERTWQRTALDAAAVTQRPVTARYTLASVETRNGVRLARIGVTIAEPAAGDDAAIDATGSILIGLDDGIVREAVLTETVAGNGDLGGAMRAFEQTTNYRLTAINGTVR